MVGKILGGRYQIIKKIGGGGMAEVYKARCTLLNRYVAIKVLRDEYRNDKEFVSRFNTEAQAAASLTHSNIVSVFDVGCEHGIHYIVMEFAEGVTLKEYIKQNRVLPWRQALDFTMQICSALDEAHRKKIIHRDIKPQNIMVCENNVLKVMDFGIARMLDRGGQTLDAKSAIGSVHYISPEQARGGYVDGKTDIYSIGVVMYEMMTGKLPFDHENPVSVAIMQMQQEPVPPRELVLSIPSAMEKICLKAMSKEQAMRYQSAAEMLADLQQVRQSIGESGGGGYTPPIDDPVPEPEPVIRPEYSEHSQKGETSDMEKRRNQRESQKKKESKKPMIAAIIAAVLLVGALTFAFARWLDPSFLSFGTTAEDGIERIPNLVGKDLNKILEEYEKKERVTIVEAEKRVASDKYGSGVIVSQKPEAGTKAGKGKIKITVVVSNGEKGDGTMPNLSGLPLSDAKAALKKLKVSYTVKEEYSDSVSRNSIIRQVPKAGSKLSEDSSIVLYVSKGKSSDKEKDDKETTEAPYLIGMSQNMAKEALESAGLTLGSVIISDSEEPAGVIIGQDPEFQTELKEGEAVSIVISSGEAPATPTPESEQEVTQETDPGYEEYTDPGVGGESEPVELTPAPDAQ